MRWLLLLLFLLPTVQAWAQSKTGTSVGQVLLIEPSARVSGMGNAGVSMYGEATAAFYNPALLGRMDRSQAQFTRSAWLAGITYHYAAAAVRVGSSHTLLLTATMLDSGEMDVRTVEQELGTGERYRVSDLALGIGYTRALTDRFSAGIHAKYLRETIWHSEMSAFAVDVGVFYQLPFGAYLGASLSNYGTRGRFNGRDLRIRYDQNPDLYGDNSNLPAALETEDFPLPVLFRVGLGYPVRVNSYSNVLFVVDAFQPSDNTESVSFGAEWNFFDLLSLRGGYQHLFQQDNEFGLTLGGGLQYDITALNRVQFDYAWGSHEFIGATHRFTLGFSF